MLQNAYFLAKIGADTAENEQHFAEILPKIGNYPTGRLTPRRMAGCAKTGDGRRAQELLANMALDGVRADIITSTAPV